MAKKIAFSGVCVAMALSLMVLTTLLTFNTLFLMCAATVFIPLVLTRCGRLHAVCALIASALLVFFFVPDKILCLEFTLLGIYTICKNYIEKINPVWIEWTVKIALYLTAACFLGFLFFKEIENIWLIILAGAAVFVIYDIALSMVISYITKKLANIKKNG